VFDSSVFKHLQSDYAALATIHTHSSPGRKYTAEPVDGDTGTQSEELKKHLYRKVPKVMPLVTFGFSGLFLSLLSEGRYFRGVATFG